MSNANYIEIVNTGSPVASVYANATTEAVALANSRSAFHAGNGGKLIALQVVEHTQYPAGTTVATACGADVANPGISTREVAGGSSGVEGLLLRQKCVVGNIPLGNYPVQSLA